MERKLAFAICQFAFSIKFLAYVVIFMTQERRESRAQEVKKWPANEDKFYVARKLRTLFIVQANVCPFADEPATYGRRMKLWMRVD